jgi:hypothetical protein
MSESKTKGRESRCKARTKAGKPCRAAATEGGLCFFHANPDKASELGRIGGRSKCWAAGESADPLPTLDNPIAVRDTLDRWMAEVYSGKLHPRVAAGLAQLLNLQLRVTAQTDVERRVAKLEKQVAEADPGEGVAGDAAVRQLDSATSPSPKPEEGGNADAEPTN